MAEFLTLPELIGFYHPETGEPWAIKGLLASCIVGVTCGVLGCFLVLRNMSLIGDALSHAVLPGVVVSYMIFGNNDVGFFIGATIAGLLTSILITWIQQNVRTENDAAMGIVFTAMFAIGVIGISIISDRPGTHLDLDDFLFGQLLGVSSENLILTGMVGTFVILSIMVLFRQLFISTFQPIVAITMNVNVGYIHYFLMLLLSFAIVASLQTVGVILVVAMLVTPAATALLLADRLSTVLVIAGVVGLLASFLGWNTAIIIDIPPGPSIALMVFFFYLIAAVFAPKRGLLTRLLARRKLSREINQTAS